MKKSVKLILMILAIAAALGASWLVVVSIRDAQLEKNFQFKLNQDGKGYTICGYRVGARLDGNLIIPARYKNKPVTKIGADAFDGTNDTIISTYLERVEIPDTITHIEKSAFANCRNLNSVFFEKNSRLEEIGDWAFSSCYMKEINLPDREFRVGEGAFDGAFSKDMILTEYENAYYFGWNQNPYRLLVRAKDKFITSCTIHENTEEILSDAFYSTEITTIAIPFKVTRIGESAFKNCDNLREVVLSEGLVKIGASAFCDCAIETIVIPTTVLEIGNAAFYMGLEEVTIPPTVRKMGYNAFGYCGTVSVYSSVLPSEWDPKWFGDTATPDIIDISEEGTAKRNKLQKMIDGWNAEYEQLEWPSKEAEALLEKINKCKSALRNPYHEAWAEID